MSVDYYQMLNNERPCDHRGSEIKKSYIDTESACCKGKEIVQERKFFCKLLQREVICSLSSGCWTCSAWKK